VTYTTFNKKQIKSMNQKAESREETELIPLGVLFEMRKV